MDMFTGMLSSQAPAKQTATATIATLCDRLQHATLLEDRRAAVQGLRSFAREYRESVASGGLRALIGTLAKDSEDTDTVKVVLETILMLFVRDEASASVEQPDDISLWLADEFTQKQDNISLLIDLLDTSDFYSRLYPLQILSTIIKHRPDRTRECIFTAPLGISRLAAILDEPREMVRNEGVVLLSALTENHSDIQKLVAFENTFDRAFRIIEAEGGVDGGVIVQDCLRLISNLLAFNASNQTYFRETSCFPRLANLFDVQGEPPVFAKEWRIINLCESIAICRLFVVPGGTGTPANQISFWQNGITAIVVHLAFSPASDQNVRTEALAAIADMIRANSALQENFAQLQVESPLQQQQQPPVANGETAEQPIETVYVIEGLLDLALLSNSVSIAALNMRIAAGKCIQAYFYDNPPIRMHFLNRAIEGFSSGADETANILMSLMELDSDARADPYKTWLSSVIFFHLIFDDPEAKKVVMGVTSGEEEEGEEVVTAIQTFSANLIAAVQHNLDNRISVAFLMALCMFLFDDPDAVDDFLSEGSSVQSLVAIVTASNKSDLIVQGLCAFLLGIIYEFSHKDSPIPRAKLHPILSGGMGRDQYVHKLDCLRKHPLIRDFEVSEDLHVDKPGLPDIFFDAFFVDFLKDNFSRILRAIDKDPSEARAANVPATRASAEMAESLKEQLQSKEEELSKKETAYLTLEHQFSQEQEELRRLKESSAATIQKVKDIAAREIANLRDENQELVDQYNADIIAEREASEKALNELKASADKAYQELKESNEKALKEQKEAMLQQQTQAVEVARMELESLFHTDLEAEKRARLQALREMEDRLAKDKEQAIETVRREAKEQFDMTLTEEKESNKQALRQLEGKFAEQKREAVEAAIQDVVKEKDATIAKLQEEQNSAAAKFEEEKAAAITKLDEEKNKAIAQLEEEKNALQIQIMDVEAESASEVEKYKSEAKKLKTELESLQKKLDTEVKKLKDENSELKKKHETESKKLKDENAELKKKYDAEVKKAKDTASASSKKADGNEKKLTEENKKLKDQVTKHEAEIKKLKEESTSNSKKANTAAAASDKKQADENKKLKDQVKKLEADLKKAKDETESKKANEKEESKKLEEELKTLKESLAEKEEKAKDLQTELDDLLIVMSDLEEKKGLYKDKAKELGGEVSEDDEDEEDGELD